ncbi:unnamed protein product, partial [Didymodactylos carnosus]
TGSIEVFDLKIPDRMVHIAAIVQQAFRVFVEPNRLIDKLSVMKQKTIDGHYIFKHNKNLNEELSKYASSTSHHSTLLTSTPFCLPICIEPASNQCPQCGNQFNAQTTNFKTIRLYLANGTITDATIVSYACKSSSCFLELHPNFMTCFSNDEPPYCLTTTKYFSHGAHIYLGGQTAFEITIFRQYSCLFACNVNKEYASIESLSRACGIFVIATNCRVVVGFEEILRNESKKQVLQALANAFTLAPTLPRFVIYDAGCLLTQFLRSNSDDKGQPIEILDSKAAQILKNEVRFFVDKFHLSNHKEKEVYQANTLGNSTASSVTTKVNINISQLSPSSDMEDGISFSIDDFYGNEEVFQIDDDAEDS